MADRFFAPDLDPAADSYGLSGAEAHHLMVVCRAKPGTEVALFDGRGGHALARVIEGTKRGVSLAILEHVHTPPPPPCTIAAAIPKGDRAMTMIEKLTELGVTTFRPLACERSVTLASDAKRSRFERAVLEACKQSGRDTLMTIEPLTPALTLLSEPGANRYLMDFSGEESGWLSLGNDPLVAIGPEGGWTPRELETARQAGWRILRWPGSILRVETAALAAATAISLARASQIRN